MRASSACGQVTKTGTASAILLAAVALTMVALTALAAVPPSDSATGDRTATRGGPNDTASGDAPTATTTPAGTPPANVPSAGTAPPFSVRLPAYLTMTAYDTGSSGFNMAVAVGKALKESHGTDLRVLPAGNDIARLAPLKGGRAQASAMGIGVYYAQEGVFEFAANEWGPQPLRLILSAVDCNAISLGVAKDTGVRSVKDLKGRRIGLVIGSPALNQNAIAVLAYGGLGPADVKLVEFPSYGAMWKGLVDNEVDAAIASTISGQAKEAESSPRGLVYPPTPTADAAGWARIRAIAPYYAPRQATCGPEMSAANPVELPSYPYPIFATYASQSTELVRSLATAMIATYPAYRDAAPGAAGLGLARQNLTWVLPYHDGAIAAMKAAGAWKPEHQAHNDALVRRQQVLATAWQAFQASRPATDETAQRQAWMRARAKALTAANLPVVFAP